MPDGNSRTDHKTKKITGASFFNMDLLFSVVIPTYNRAGLIGLTIRSFLEQDHKSFEILVVDDGGTDNTKEIISSFNDQRIQYLHKENGERGAARNYGAAGAKGKYITFFDSDDLVYPWFLSHAKEKITQLNLPECYAQAFEFRKNANEIPRVIDNTNNTLSAINKKLQNENILACNGVFVRKDIFDRFNFSENRGLSGSEDWFLWLQLSSVYPFYYSPVVCSCLIMHDQRGEFNIEASKLVKRLNVLLSLIKTDKHITRLSKKYYKKILSSGHNFAALKMAAFTKLKFKSIYNLFKAFLLNPSIVTQRATYVAIKQLLFRWQ
jgi:glycosyltransferase involved in cell wall biosynthesis